ncbi:hypothetical protein [Citrobacter meridianamericanus]|uniref:hypothetical protein n=1 Tax=Citrobacter meridianamericanus TaxID=2894201 RepID=UPI00351D262D
MKINGIYGVVAALVLSSPSAMAQSECQLTLSQPTVGFNTFRREDSVNTRQQWHQMPTKEISVNAYCPQDTVMGVFVQGSAGQQGRFLFGNGGGLAVRVSQLVVDGRHYSVAKTSDRQNLTAEENAGETLLIHNNDGIVAVENHAQVSGKQMSFTLTLTPVLNDNQFSHTTDVTSLEADLRWELLTR